MGLLQSFVQSLQTRPASSRKKRLGSLQMPWLERLETRTVPVVLSPTIIPTWQLQGIVSGVTDSGYQTADKNYLVNADLNGTPPDPPLRLTTISNPRTDLSRLAFANSVTFSPIQNWLERSGPSSSSWVLSTPVKLLPSPGESVGQAVSIAFSLTNRSAASAQNAQGSGSVSVTASITDSKGASVESYKYSNSKTFNNRSSTTPSPLELFWDISQNDSNTFSARIGDTFKVTITITVNSNLPFNAGVYGDAVVDEGLSLQFQSTALGQDLSVDQIAWDAAQTGVDVTYSIGAALPLSPLSNLKVYWATGDQLANIVGAPVLTQPVGQVTGSNLKLHVPASALNNPPTGATHLIAVINQDKSVPDSFPDNNFLALKRNFGLFKITANHDDITDPQIFGPYLTVKTLPTLFTLTPQDSSLNGVASVTWSINGPTLSGAKSMQGTARKNGDVWEFTADVGNLAVGDHGLTITVKDAAGKILASQEGGLLHLINQLNFEINVQAGTALIADTEARFFTGITAPVNFQGTVTNLPTYYRSEVHVQMGSVTGTVVPIGNSATDTTFHFQMHTDVSPLAPTLNTVNFYVGALPVTTWGDQPEHLLSVRKPTWLTTGNPSYDPDTGIYQWRDAHPDLLKYQAPALNTGVSWIDDYYNRKFATYFQLQAKLNIDASVQLSKTPKYTASQLQGTAQILGDTLWDRTFTSRELVFGGSLDPKTLDPSSFSIRLAHPISYSQELYNSIGHVAVTKLISPNIPEWLLEVDLIFALKVMGNMSFDAGLELSMNNGQVVFVGGSSTPATDSTGKTANDGTFISIVGSGSASGSVGLHAKAFEFVKGYSLAEGKALGTATPVINFDGNVHFAGYVLSPTIASARLTSTFGLKYKLQGTYRVARHKEDFDTGELSITPYTLFDISK